VKENFMSFLDSQYPFAFCLQAKEKAKEKAKDI
jgi:hypothetical protein